MPKITKVKIDDLVAASQRYVDTQLKAADVNRNKLLTPTEAKRLAADLRDNFDSSQFKLPNGSVKVADVAKEFVVMMQAWAQAADKNHDGYLSTTETKALPKNLRDNVVNFMHTQEKAVVSTGGYSTRDTTPAARIREHLSAFGTQPIDYQKAFAIAIKAVATEKESGLPAFVSEFGGPDGSGLTDPKKIAAEVKTLLKNGSMELVPTNEEIPTGEKNKNAWIFSVSTDGQGDNGLWAIVDRKTGEATVTNFN